MDEVKYLLNRGADIEAHTMDGSTPLIYGIFVYLFDCFWFIIYKLLVAIATRGLYFETVKELLKRGANVLSHHGNTALHYGLCSFQSLKKST